MKKLYLTLFTILSLFPFFAEGQTFYKIPSSATFPVTTPIGTNIVTTKTGSGAIQGSYCGIPMNDGFWVGQGGPTSFKHSFSFPISQVRINVTGINSGEEFSIWYNGVPYSISLSDISTFSGCSGPTTYLIQNGALLSTSSVLGAGENAQLNIIFPVSVDSIEVFETHQPGTGGSVYEIFFVNDTCYYPFTATANTPCAHGTLNLSVDSIPGVSDYTWIKGATPLPTLARNQSIPNAVTTDAGTYYVTATKGNCTYSSFVTASINTAPPPTPNTTINNGPLCPGSTLNLSTGTVAGVSGYVWTGPNNFQSSQQNATLPNITSLAEGKYYVRTTSSTNGCLSEPDSTTLVMYFPTAPPIAGGNNLVCRGTTLNLTASNIPNATYTWVGPNNFQSNVQNPVRTNMAFADSGVYYITATVTGCTSLPDTIHVSVKVLTATPHGTSNSPVCPGTNIIFSSVYIPTATYSWTGPNFSSALQNPVLANAALTDAGPYYVTANINGCISEPDTVDVVVAISSATPEASNNSPVCPGKTLQLNSTTIPNSTYEWKGPGFSSTDQNPSIPNVSTANAGMYYLYSVINGCKSLPDSIEVKVEVLTPTPQATGNALLCRGDDLNITVQDIPNATYSWKGPGNFASVNQNFSIPKTTAADSGIYIVTANVDGCISLPDTIAVAFKPMPDIISVSSNSPVCEGDSLNLMANGYIHDDKVVYSWAGPDNFSKAPSHIAEIKETTLASEGKYTVTGFYDGCVSEPRSIDVDIKPKPAIPKISARTPARLGDTLRVSASSATPGVVYRWSCPDGIDRTDTSFIVYDVSKAAQGKYIVTTYLDGCSSSAELEIEVTDKETFTLYPNPNNGTFTVKVTLKKDMTIPISVINPVGQVLYLDEGKTKGKLMIKTIQLGANFPNGVYILRLGLDGQTRDMRFVIRR